MRIRPALVVPALLLLAAACGPAIRYERDANVRLKTGDGWAWGAPDNDGLSIREGALVPEDSVARLIADAIEHELVDRGFPRVRAESAQFVVHFHIGQRQVTDTFPVTDDRTAPDGVRGTPGRWGGYGTPEEMRDRTFTWEEGMLIVDAVVPSPRVVAWRGIIAGEVPERARRAPAAAIDQAVKRLMRGFP